MNLFPRGVPADLEPVSADLSQDLNRRGAIIMSVFALIWAIAVPGVGSMTAQLAAVAVALVVTASIVMLALWRTATPTRTRRMPTDWQRRYNLVGLAEAGIIGTAVVILLLVSQPDLIAPVVCLIVGVHFFPLAKIFDQREYSWTGVALCAVGTAAIVVPGIVDAEATGGVAGFGAAAVLWVTALVVIRSTDAGQPIG